MSDIVLTTLLSVVGGIIGSMSGVLATAKLIIWRLDRAEKRLDNHDRLGDRVTVVEQSVKSAHHRIDEVKEVLQK